MHTPLALKDYRHACPGTHAIDHHDQLVTLLRATRRTFGGLSDAAAHILLPLGDAMARRWLARTQNPYLPEIDRIAAHRPVRGLYALNLSYEWGCSGTIRDTADGPTLLRVLDWPFPGLGTHTTALHLRGPAGEYLNLSWPGLAGSFQGLAPGRFAAAINQAPMRRHGWGLAGDWLINRRRMFREDGLPPAHLLRQVFEQASDYEEAKRRLRDTPLCLPVIFLLSGTRPGEGCIIERLERDAHVRELADEPSLAVTNHFHSERLNASAKGWLSRALDSHARCRIMQTWGDGLLESDFHALPYPILSQLTRLTARMNAATGALNAQAWEAEGPVSDTRHLALA